MQNPLRKIEKAFAPLNIFVFSRPIEIKEDLYYENHIKHQ